MSAEPVPLPDPYDEVLLHLDDLVRSLNDGASLVRATLGRARELREQRLQGLSYSDIVVAEPRPLIVEMISDYVAAVATAGSRFRHAEARALRAEGMTTQAIADLFGVTRQRISAILNDGEPHAAGVH
jgi:hypothetical protein